MHVCECKCVWFIQNIWTFCVLATSNPLANFVIVPGIPKKSHPYECWLWCQTSLRFKLNCCDFIQSSILRTYHSTYSAYTLNTIWKWIWCWNWSWVCQISSDSFSSLLFHPAHQNDDVLNRIWHRFRAHNATIRLIIFHVIWNYIQNNDYYGDLLSTEFYYYASFSKWCRMFEKNHLTKIIRLDENVV